MVRNFWNILNAILCKKISDSESLKQGHDSYLANEANIWNKSDFDYSL